MTYVNIHAVAVTLFCDVPLTLMIFLARGIDNNNDFHWSKTGSVAKRKYQLFEQPRKQDHVTM